MRRLHMRRTCDDAWRNEARSGVVILDTADMLFHHSGVRREMYKRAIKQSEASFDIVSAELPSRPPGD